MDVSRLEVKPVRDAFRHEAYNLTQWLEENIDALGERIGLSLTVENREYQVGSFRVDLLCKDDSGRTVIVENQLETSDHDHLGKVLTYFVNLEAKVAIWIVPAVRPEHQRVVDWLNQVTELAFYLVKLEAVRIGNSPYAPLFSVLAAPDEQSHQIGEVKKGLAEREINRKAFWTQLLELSRGRTNLFANVTPNYDYSISTGSGTTGIRFSYVILKNGAGIDLMIDRGKQFWNKAYFDKLFQNKDQIEMAFGKTLDWQRLSNKRASRIMWRFSDNGSLNTPDQWPELQSTLIEAMIRFHAALTPYIKQLPFNRVASSAKSDE